MADFANISEKPNAGVLDVSVSTNPLGMPETVKNMDIILSLNEYYPDSECTELRKALASKYSVQPESIYCGNGADDIIYRISQGLKPKRGLIAAPTYEDYEAALKTIDCDISHYIYKSEYEYHFDCGILDNISSDIVFIANPNNPTGELIGRKHIERLAEKCRDAGAVLVVDESFMGFTDERESAKELVYKYSNMIVIDSFTKTYCMPGFRLGFCLCSDKSTLDKIKRAGQASAVSVYAQAAALMALEDKEYINLTNSYVKKEREYLIDGLNRAGLKAYNSDANFFLVKSPYNGFIKKLADSSVIVRDCRRMTGLEGEHFRVSVKKHEDNVRFIETVYRIVNE